MDATGQLKCKITMLGDGAVGKTSLIRRFVSNQYSDEYVHTIGAKVMKKQINFSLEGGSLAQVVMMLWDIPGQWETQRSRILSFQKYKPKGQYFIGSKGGLAICDITRKDTLDNLHMWVKALHDEAGDVPVVFLANKSDQTAQHQFTIQDLQALSKKYNAPTYLSSAKTGDNVELAFHKLAALVYRKYKCD